MATTNQYLDYVGLEKLVTLIKEKFLLQTTASSTYLAKNDASSTYLAKNDASSTYLTKNDAGNTYLTKGDAQSTYLSLGSADEIYLSKDDATTTYLTDVTVSSNTGLVSQSASTSGAKTITLDFSGLSGKISGIETSINRLSNAVHFVGVTTTELKNESSTTSITIGSSTINALKGDVVIYGQKEFVFDGSRWRELGDTTPAMNAITALNTYLYGEDGTMAAPEDGSFVKTVNSNLTSLKTWQDGHVGHAAIPKTGSDSVEAAFNAGMAL